MHAAVNAGSANRITQEIVRVLYRKRGMRLTAMPGARNRKIVMTKLIAPPVVEIVRKMSASA